MSLLSSFDFFSLSKSIKNNMPMLSIPLYLFGLVALEDPDILTRNLRALYESK